MFDDAKLMSFENESSSSKNDLNDDENSSISIILKNFVDSTKKDSLSKNNWKTFEKSKKLKMSKISLDSEFALPLLLFTLKNLFTFVI